MRRKILRASMALCAFTSIGTLAAPHASAAMYVVAPMLQHPYLQLAAYDSLVYRAQVGLNRNGYNTGTPDGQLGARTRSAIEAYQRANGMTVTGYPNDSLITQIEGGQPAQPGNTAARRNTSLSQTEMINQTQSELRRHGFTITDFNNGLNGETTTAISSYQQAHGLERTGAPSETLLATLRSDNTTGSSNRPARGDNASNRRGSSLSQTELINQTQSELRRHGYTITDFNNGLNGETTTAISSYQQAHGLERTGAPSAPLLATMRRDNPTGSSAPATPVSAAPIAPAQAVECADWLHQGRPGGSDYRGPPVQGCP